MGFKNWITRYTVRGAIPCVLTMCFAYFLYHTFQGDHGLFGLVELSRACKQQEQQLQLLVQEKELLENKVCLMSDKIDLDLLEYQVRLLLGYRAPHEMLILTPFEPKEAF